MTTPQFNTTAEIFTPNKCRRAKVRGMRPVLDYAERRGVERVESWPLAPVDDAPMRCKAIFKDGFFALYTLQNAAACREFHRREWPGVTIERK